MLHCFATEHARLWRSLQRHPQRSSRTAAQRSAIPHQQADSRTRPDVRTAGECRTHYTRDCTPTLAHAQGSTSCCEHATAERRGWLHRSARLQVAAAAAASARLCSTCTAVAHDSGNALEPYNCLPCPPCAGVSLLADVRPAGSLPPSLPSTRSLLRLIQGANHKGG